MPKVGDLVWYREWRGVVTGERAGIYRVLSGRAEFHTTAQFLTVIPKENNGI